jgi:hypothetical protein
MTDGGCKFVNVGRRVVMQNLYAKARVLEVLEHEINEVFNRLQYKHVAPSPAMLRRLHAANLPLNEAQEAMKILGKIAAIEHSTSETEKVGCL